MTNGQRASERSPRRSPPGPESQAGPGRRGEFAFKLGRREIGHLHGDASPTSAFQRTVWADLFEKGRIDYHPVFPGQAGLWCAQDRDRS